MFRQLINFRPSYKQTYNTSMILRGKLQSSYQTLQQQQQQQNSSIDRYYDPPQYVHMQETIWLRQLAIKQKATYIFSYNKANNN
jgi:hypothetical protein